MEHLVLGAVCVGVGVLGGVDKGGEKAKGRTLAVATHARAQSYRVIQSDTK